MNGPLAFPDKQAESEVVAAAAQWAATLAEAGVGHAQREACEHWCREHPLHRQTLERMLGFDHELDGTGHVGRSALKSLLMRSAQRRKRGGSAILAIALFAGAGWLALQTFTVRALSPDYVTARGELRHIVLAEGSTIDLDTDAALDVRASVQHRDVTLFRGRLLAHVAHDPARPFVVETREGTATALGTAFVVDRRDDRTVVTVVQSRVRVCTARSHECLVLVPGQRAELRHDFARRLSDIDAAQAGAWAEGWLAVDDRPIAEVLEELNRYRADPIRFDAARLAGRRVTGSFPLTDPDRALEGVARATGLTLGQASEHRNRAR